MRNTKDSGTQMDVPLGEECVSPTWQTWCSQEPPGGRSVAWETYWRNNKPDADVQQCGERSQSCSDQKSDDSRRGDQDCGYNRGNRSDDVGQRRDEQRRETVRDGPDCGYNRSNRSDDVGQRRDEQRRETVRDGPDCGYNCSNRSDDVGQRRDEQRRETVRDGTDCGYNRSNRSDDVGQRRDEQRRETVRGCPDRGYANRSDDVGQRSGHDQNRSGDYRGRTNYSVRNDSERQRANDQFRTSARSEYLPHSPEYQPNISRYSGSSFSRNLPDVKRDSGYGNRGGFNNSESRNGNRRSTNYRNNIKSNLGCDNWEFFDDDCRSNPKQNRQTVQSESQYDPRKRQFSPRAPTVKTKSYVDEEVWDLEPVCETTTAAKDNSSSCGTPITVCEQKEVRTQEMVVGTDRTSVTTETWEPTKTTRNDSTKGSAPQRQTELVKSEKTVRPVDQVSATQKPTELVRSEKPVRPVDQDSFRGTNDLSQTVGSTDTTVAAPPAQTEDPESHLPESLTPRQKLKERGLPIRLPRSCQFSSTYEKWMAGSDYEGEVGEGTVSRKNDGASRQNRIAVDRAEEEKMIGTSGLGKGETQEVLKPEEMQKITDEQDEFGVEIVTTSESVVETVTPNESGVETVTPDESGVETITRDESGVETVTPDESGVETVTPDESGVEMVIQSEPGVEMVIPIESGVDTVTPDESGVETVTPDESGVETVTPDESGVETVTPKESGLETVTPDESGVEIVTQSESGVETLTPIESGVDTVTPDESALETVTSYESVVDTVTPDESGVETVTPDEPGLETVTPDKSGLETVTSDESGVETVTPDESGVEIVTPDESGVEMVTPDESGVKTVTSDESGVETVTPDESGVEIVTPDESGVEMVTPDESRVEMLAPEESEVEMVNLDEPGVEMLAPEESEVEMVTPYASGVEMVAPDLSGVDTVTVVETGKECVAEEREGLKTVEIESMVNDGRPPWEEAVVRDVLGQGRKSQDGDVSAGREPKESHEEDTKEADEDSGKEIQGITLSVGEVNPVDELGEPQDEVDLYNATDEEAEKTTASEEEENLEIGNVEEGEKQVSSGKGLQQAEWEENKEPTETGEICGMRAGDEVGNNDGGISQGKDAAVKVNDDQSNGDRPAASCVENIESQMLSLTLMDVSNTDDGTQAEVNELPVPPPPVEVIQRVYSPPEISVNDDGNVAFMMSYIESPGRFWVHLVTENSYSAIESLMHDLNQYYKTANKVMLKKFFEGDNDALHLNNICCAQFSEDNDFYRVEIVSLRYEVEERSPGVADTSAHVIESGDTCRQENQSRRLAKVKVFYIDFGNGEWLSPKRIYPLPPLFATLAPQAVCCRLVVLEPLTAKDSGAGGDGVTDSTLEVTKWSSEATQKFTELTGFDKKLFAYVTGINDGEMLR